MIDLPPLRPIFACPGIDANSTLRRLTLEDRAYLGLPYAAVLPPRLSEREISNVARVDPDANSFRLRYYGMRVMRATAAGQLTDTGYVQYRPTPRFLVRNYPPGEPPIDEYAMHLSVGVLVYQSEEVLKPHLPHRTWLRAAMRYAGPPAEVLRWDNGLAGFVAERSRLGVS